MNTIERALGNSGGNEGNRPRPENNDRARAKPRKSNRVDSDTETQNSIHIDLLRLEQKGMLTPDNGRSKVAEEMRSVKRPLLKNAFGQKVSGDSHNNLIMVTSAVPGEGKSFSSINLAISMTMELDKTVLLIDADVAKPSVANYLGFRSDKGLIDYLVDEKLALSDVMLKTNIPKLSILPAGRHHPHATEVLASDAMFEFTRELSNRYPDRVIIFDSPPLLATSESRVLAGLMGQILVVVESVKTTQPVLKEALSYLDPTQQIVGLLLNKTRGKNAEGYSGSYYGYGAYGENAGSENFK
ncbi:MAG: XrtA-associated tyrosine autokinase [Gammaproteobacteria bacterium]|nr:XrtA-associated tyrosine autokinase [Gammaproteobacteria bacterium]MDH5691957.1 XrtA-associated tyrosine autokinase [Gammaproteobacteria bacterium]